MVCVVWVGRDGGLGTASGRVGSYYVCASCVDGRYRYLHIVLGGYLRIFGASSVQSYCNLCYRYRLPTVYDRYRKSRHVCV